MMSFDYKVLYMSKVAKAIVKLIKLCNKKFEIKLPTMPKNVIGILNALSCRMRRTVLEIVIRITAINVSTAH